MDKAGAGELVYVGDAMAPATLPALLTARAEASPGDLFVRFRDESVSYGQMRARAGQAAASLAAAGVGRGDRVAIMLPHCLEFLDIWFGAALLGAAFVPVNLGLRGDGLRYVLEHSEPRLIVADESVVPALRAALPEGAASGRCFVRGAAFPGWEPLSQVLAGSYASPRLPAVSPDDLATVLLWLVGSRGHAQRRRLNGARRPVVPEGQPRTSERGAALISASVVRWMCCAIRHAAFTSSRATTASRIWRCSSATSRSGSGAMDPDHHR
ncbi:hypothetical protein ETD83_33065 [Actinomadura soli]|uniref:AMP-dependent synthetase/ligase domain-containing protein n=1 Tax=Actinomadura soli TaxID=2508997 RepID=A0A5C4J3E1_9ACTN|nr:hypothetical protein ETD83_33065 [Actinomadura soli]